MLVVTVIIAAVVSAFASDMGGLDGSTGPDAVLESQMDLDSGELTIEITYTVDAWGMGDPDWYETITQTLKIHQGSSPNPHGIIFTHMGGDALDLKDLQMGVSTNNLAAIIDYDSIRNQASSLEAPSLKYSSDDTSLVDVTVSSAAGYTFEEIESLIDSIDADEYEETHTLEKYFIKIDPETGDDTIIRPGDMFEFVTDDSESSQVPDWWAISCTNDGMTESLLFERGSGNEWVLSHKQSGAILASGAIEFPDT